MFAVIPDKDIGCLRSVKQRQQSCYIFQLFASVPKYLICSIEVAFNSITFSGLKHEKAVSEPPMASGLVRLAFLTSTYLIDPVKMKGKADFNGV